MPTKNWSPRGDSNSHRPVTVYCLEGSAGTGTLLWSREKRSKLQPQPYQDCALPLELSLDGTGVEDRTLLQLCVGQWPSPEGDPGMKMADGVGFEPTAGN
jgi:hypothetical protein